MSIFEKGKSKILIDSKKKKLQKMCIFEKAIQKLLIFWAKIIQTKNAYLKKKKKYKK